MIFCPSPVYCGKIGQSVAIEGLQEGLGNVHE